MDDADAGPGDDSRDEEQLRAYADALADGIEAALPGWVERSVGRVLAAWTEAVGADAAAEVAGRARAAAPAAGVQARDEVAPAVRALLLADIDEQRANPLAIVRRAVRFPTAVLAEAGVPEVVRDRQAEAHFPDDVYDLAPASFADLDPGLREPGLAWGAAKAHVHLRRRRAEGKR